MPAPRPLSLRLPCGMKIESRDSSVIELTASCEATSLTLDINYVSIKISLVACWARATGGLGPGFRPPEPRRLHRRTAELRADPTSSCRTTISTTPASSSRTTTSTTPNLQRGIASLLAPGPPAAPTPPAAAAVPTAPAVPSAPAPPQVPGEEGEQANDEGLELANNWDLCKLLNDRHSTVSPDFCCSRMNVRMMEDWNMK